MTITTGALALLTLALLIWRGGGGRVALIFGALSGALIGGVLTTIAATIFSGGLTLGSALLHALP